MQASFDSQKPSNEKLRVILDQYLALDAPRTYGSFVHWLEKSNTSIRPNFGEMKEFGKNIFDEPIGEQTVVLDGEPQIKKYNEGIR